MAPAKTPSTPASRRRGPARRRGRRGGRTSPSASGARSARTTAPTATPGTHFTHDQARSRAYRWGEDGLAGISDDRQRLCLALALWNGADPILKERMFGLTNSEGNHGEDAKEYWFYLDSTPTHSYLKCLYKYPQRAFPYGDLVAENGRRGKLDYEYELLDTGIFDDDRYFDVVVEYAKAAHDDILMRVTAHNRGPDAATLHVLPTLWFRNTWSWGGDVAKPSIADGVARHPELGEWRFDTDGELWYCDNETGSKAAINDHLIARRRRCSTSGTKCAAHHLLEVPAGESREVRVRLTASTTRRRLRRRLRHPHRGGRRVLRDRHPGHARRRQDARHAPGAGRAAVGQAVLRVRRPPLAARARRQPVGPERAGRAQRPLVPHGRRRRHLDAGQVGVPVVRGLGPGVPLRAAVAGRRRLRQGAGRAAPAHALHPPQRADPGVRVELLRRQPAGDGVGGAVGLPARGGDPRRGRPRLARAHLPAPADELHLVGQPQGPRRAQPLPGRLPRPRQHRDLRPLGAAAGRRDAAPGRRHRVDGALLPVDAADRGRARPRAIRATRTSR